MTDKIDEIKLDLRLLINAIPLNMQHNVEHLNEEERERVRERERSDRMGSWYELNVIQQTLLHGFCERANYLRKVLNDDDAYNAAIEHVLRDAPEWLYWLIVEDHVAVDIAELTPSSPGKTH